MCSILVFFFKQKTAYEMRISDWSSDVCSSDLSIGCGICCSRGEAPQSRGSSIHRAIRRGARGERILMIQQDRKSVVSGKSVSVRVDLGGRRIIKKKQLQYRDNVSANTAEIVSIVKTWYNNIYKKTKIIK